jgi:nitrogen fixation protein FixH
MQNLLLTLPLGIVLILLAFMLLRRATPLSVLNVATLVGVVMLLMVGVLGAISWPGLDVFAIHVAIFLLAIYISAVLAGQRRDAMGKAPQRHWAPVALVSFFAVVILVNTLFVVLADYGTDSIIGRWLLPKEHDGSGVHSVYAGNVSHDFREKEDQFNAYQQQRELQQQRGWQVQYGWRDLPIAGVPSVLLLTLADKQGKPLVAEQVKGMFYYPGDSRLDTTFVMQASGAGKFHAKVVMPHAGRWDMVLHIQHGTDQHEIRATTDVDKAKG